MARKRPSLRNYLVEGDLVREMEPVIAPPPLDIPDASLAGDILSSFPTEPLNLSLWGMVVSSHLIKLREGSVTIPVLKSAFPSVDEDEFTSTLNRAVAYGALALEDEAIDVNPVSQWAIPEPVSEDSPDLWLDSLVDMMTENDRAMWVPLLSKASLQPLSLDGVKDFFDKADSVSDQFFMMRKSGDGLLPITRSSQIRLPLEAVIMWSEKGDSVVFFG